MCSICITKSITPPPSPQPKQWKLPCDGRTVNDGVFSSWNGQRPFSEPAPARRSATYSPTTSSIRVRSRTSAMSLSRIRPAMPPSLGIGLGKGGASRAVAGPSTAHDREEDPCSSTCPAGRPWSPARRSGIGRAIAADLARAGARVVVNGRTEPRVDARRHATCATRPAVRSSAWSADVATARVPRELAAREPARRRAGQQPRASSAPSPPSRSPTTTWRRYFEVNVLAGVAPHPPYLPGMTARGWGRVLDIASDSAVVIPAEMIHYGMSKTALLAVSRGFAKEAAGTGVTVNSVIAGPDPHRRRRGVRAPARGRRRCRGTRRSASSCARTGRSRCSSG